LFTGCAAQVNSGQEKVKEAGKKEILSLYFPNKTSGELTLEKRFVAQTGSTSDKVKLVLAELKKGPISKELVSSFPERGDVKLVKIQNKTAFIDMDKDFVSSHPGGSLGELSTVYSIVNSVTAVDGAEKVEFTIDGKKTDEFKGHINAADVFTSTVVED